MPSSNEMRKVRAMQGVDSQKHGFHCRRCNSARLGKLKKQADGDNDVFRCLECGHIFSPAPEQGDENVTERRSKDA